MKKILAVSAAAMLCLSAGCGKKTSKASELPSETATASESVTEPATLQPDPLAPKETSTAVTVTASKTTTTTSARPQHEQPDPIGGAVFEYNNDGAVVFNEDPSAQDDSVLILAAQALFESACRTEWDYTVGSPYELDPNDYVENEFGWQLCRIKKAGINTMADLRADYNKVFSGRYPDQLDELYIEDDGSVYALDAARGRDLYYTGSVITGVTAKKSDEIFFTVENHYSGSDDDPVKPETQTEEFSVVIESDGTWKAGSFRLPY